MSCPHSDTKFQLSAPLPTAQIAVSSNYSNECSYFNRRGSTSSVNASNGFNFTKSATEHNAENVLILPTRRHSTLGNLSPMEFEMQAELA